MILETYLHPGRARELLALSKLKRRAVLARRSADKWTAQQIEWHHTDAYSLAERLALHWRVEAVELQMHAARVESLLQHGVSDTAFVRGLR